MQHESFASQIYNIDGIPDEAFRLWLLLQETAFNLSNDSDVWRQFIKNKTKRNKTKQKKLGKKTCHSLLENLIGKAVNLIILWNVTLKHLCIFNILRKTYPA